MNIFDIGTNHGNFTDEHLKIYPDANFICIEANPVLCSFLVDKYKNNKNIKVYHYVMSDKSGENISFYINKDCDGISTASKNWVDNSRFNKTNWNDAILIETITLDDLINSTFVPDILKVDVEGYENTVLRGLTKKANIIQFEWAEEELVSIQDTCNYLQSIGYNNFAFKFGDIPYTDIPSTFNTLEKLNLFENLIPDRKDKWGMIYAK
jgi:FkbM family methyltransferase